MKVALSLFPCNEEHNGYGKFFEEMGAYGGRWFCPIEPLAYLRVETEIEFHYEGKYIAFEVNRWTYYPQKKLLELSVSIVECSTEVSDKQFFQFFRKNWIPGNKINTWLKMPPVPTKKRLKGKKK